MKRQIYGVVVALVCIFSSFTLTTAQDRQHTPVQSMQSTQEPTADATESAINPADNPYAQIHNEALANAQAGNFEEAIKLFKQELDLIRQRGDKRAEFSVLRNISLAYKSLAQWDNAIDYLNQALEIAPQVGDTGENIDALSKTGNAFEDLGQYDKADDAYLKALDIAQKAGDKVSEFNTLDSLAQIYFEWSQFGQALTYSNQALDIAQTLNNTEAESSTLSIIAAEYLSQGRTSQAIDYWTKANTINEATGDKLRQANVLSNMSSTFSSLGKQDIALDYATKAYDLFDSLESTDTIESLKVGVRMNIASVYQAQAKYDEADTWLKNALDLATSSKLDQDIADVKTATGDLELARGNYDKALGNFNAALDYYKPLGTFAKTVVLILYKRGQTYQGLAKYPEALSDFEEAAKLVEDVLSGAGVDSSVAGLAANEESSGAYFNAAGLLAAQGKYEEAVNYAERGRGILIRSDLTTNRIDFRAGVDKPMLDREAELKLALTNAQKQVDALSKDDQATSEAKKAAHNALEAARSDYDNQLEKMQLSGGYLSRQIANNVASLQDIQKALPDDTTLVMYATGKFNSGVFLITRDSVTSVGLDATQDQIKAQVNTFNADRKTNADSVLRKLYDMVISPFADKLTTSRLIISPDGPLNYVPFAALKSGDNHYLIDDFTVSMIPSGSTLALLEARQPTASFTSAGLVLAQPGTPSLKEANNEAKNIADVLGVSPILNASVADLRNNAAGSRIITISAHATLQTRSPIYSSIELGGDDTASGHFEVRNVYELDLTQGTQLVVLSGCNTASGGNGEEFGVFTRAFLAAGTPRVVASLWSIDDSATSLLIPKFISEQAKSQDQPDYAGALRSAMLETRKQYPDPYYWASFVLVGLP